LKLFANNWRRHFILESSLQNSMTGDQSRLLKPFDRVCWQNDQADQGTATEKNWAG